MEAGVGRVGEKIDECCSNTQANLDRVQRTLTEGIKSDIQALKQDMTSSFQALVVQVGQKIDECCNNTKAHLDSVKSTLREGIKSDIQALQQDMTSSFQAALERMATDLRTNVSTDLKALLERMETNLGSALQGVENSLTTSSTRLSDSMRTVSEQLADIKSRLTALLDAATFSTELAAVRRDLKDAIHALPDARLDNVLTSSTFRTDLTRSVEAILSQCRPTSTPPPPPPDPDMMRLLRDIDRKVLVESQALRLSVEGINLNAVLTAITSLRQQMTGETQEVVSAITNVRQVSLDRSDQVMRQVTDKIGQVLAEFPIVQQSLKDEIATFCKGLDNLDLLAFVSGDVREIKTLLESLATFSVDWHAEVARQFSHLITRSAGDSTPPTSQHAGRFSQRVGNTVQDFLMDLAKDNSSGRVQVQANANATTKVGAR